MGSLRPVRVESGHQALPLQVALLIPSALGS